MKEGKEMFYLTTHSTHLFMVLWHPTIGCQTLGNCNIMTCGNTLYFLDRIQAILQDNTYYSTGQI